MKRLFMTSFVVLALAGACAPAEEPQSVEPQETSTATPTQSADDAPQTPDATSPTEPVSCADEIGQADAQVLVDQCIMMSPATHPPCNVANSCEMIRGEIKRGCGFGDTSGNPDFCAEYE